jgi:carboxymethylenebutenolidase
MWDTHLRAKFHDKNANAVMDTMVSAPYVNHVPTLTGGRGYKDLHRWYRDYFIPKCPPSLQITLMSRTVGADRVVDEVVLRFRHTCEVPWMLPGVPPTGREVEVPVVSVVAFRGGHVCQENVYFDTGSVMVQVGLLERGTLPVVGAEGARKVLEPKEVGSNKLIRDW